MRIESLHIDGFGHYTDQSIGTFDDALTVVRGQNEAGKSTLLAFMRAVLFGFPARLGAQHHPPLRGGRHGGRIMLRLDDGRRFTVERVQGRGRGTFQARDEAGTVIDEQRFNAFIGHASETLFRSAFTFDLDDLPRFDDTDGDLGGLLYGASIGAEQLPQAMKRLDGRIEDLFKPGGSTQVTARLVHEMDRARQYLREVAGKADDYRKKTERRGQIESELGEAQAHLADLERRHTASDRHARAWKDWAHLSVLDERLAALVDTSNFPADGPGRLERLVQDSSELAVGLEEATSALADSRVEAERPFPDAELLESADAIEDLRRGRGAVDASLRDLPERRAELAGREEELQRSLEMLGVGWNEKRLFIFDLSIPRRAEIERWQRRFEEVRADQRDRVRGLEEASRQTKNAAEAQREAAEAQERLEEVLDETAVQRRGSSLVHLRDSYGQYERSRQRLADLEAQQPSAKSNSASQPGGLSRVWRVVASLVVGAVLAIGVVVALISDAPVIAAVVGVLGALVLIVAGVLAGSSRRAPVPASQVSGQFVGSLRDEVGAAEGALRKAAVGLIDGIGEHSGPLPDTGSIRAAEEAQNQMLLRSMEGSRAKERVKETTRLAEQAGTRQDDAAKAVETAREAHEQANQDWNEWLIAGDLPANLAPHTAGQLLTSVEVARTKAEELRQWRNRVEAIRVDIEQYRECVLPIAKTLQIELTASERSVVEVADAVIERFEEARDKKAMREQTRKTVADRERVHKLAEQKVAKAKQALVDLFTAASVSTIDEFHDRAVVHEERGTLKKERDECEMRLRQVFGPKPDALEALDQALRDTTIEGIEAALLVGKTEIEEAQELRDGLLGERGRVAGEIQQLHDDEAASEARSRIELLKAELEASAREWSSLVVARALLRHTREKFERERQPAVIQRAEGYFSLLTGDRYRRLYRPYGESTVTVEDRNGAIKTPEQLSRGAREQVYLALRLGAIEEAAGTNEPLPVIIDEVLVNFDPERARRAVETFAELATHTQVIVFTCHPWVADLFKYVAGNPPVITLDDSGKRERVPIGDVL